jgi:hypothetical protein
LNGITEPRNRGIAVEIEIEKIATEEQPECRQQKINVPTENIDEKGLQSNCFCSLFTPFASGVLFTPFA